MNTNTSMTLLCPSRFDGVVIPYLRNTQNIAWHYEFNKLTSVFHASVLLLIMNCRPAIEPAGTF